MFSIAKIRFGRWSASAGPLAAASVLIAIAGCGQPPAPRPAAQASPTNVAPNYVPSAVNSNGANSIDSLNQTQINAFLGNYTGSYVYTDDFGTTTTQTYTLGITKVAGSGGNFIQVAFQSQAVSFTTFVGVYSQPATTVAGNIYYLNSSYLNLPNFYSYGPVVFQLQLTVSQANQFDPASAVVLMVDPFDTSAGGQPYSVVDFDPGMRKR